MISFIGSTIEYYYSQTSLWMGTPHIHTATSTHFMEDFLFKFKTSYLQLCSYYKYCQKITLEDNYLRFSFSPTCSAIGAICSRSSLY
jgi:hypothetical protein